MGPAAIPIIAIGSATTAAVVHERNESRREARQERERMERLAREAEERRIREEAEKKKTIWRAKKTAGRGKKTAGRGNKTAKTTGTGTDWEIKKRKGIRGKKETRRIGRKRKNKEAKNSWGTKFLW